MLCHCVYCPTGIVDWEQIEALPLTGAANGEPPRLRTTVKMCRTKDDVRFLFECEDDHVVANYTRRDDPIYEEDVVEIFIDEEGEGIHYKEFEFSPANTVFDALITNVPGKKLVIDRSWDAAGMRTEVTVDASGWRRYHIAIPVSVFDTPPVSGTEWKVNFYRIDEDSERNRHYWAWSPTGVVDFHTPSRFGVLRFE